MKESEVSSCLVVAAHPDDEVLGCGGLIKKITHTGNKINLLILGEGVTSRFKKREEADQSLVDEIYIQCEKVSKILGINNVYFKNFPDNRFDSVPILDIVKSIESVIEEVSANAIFTHHVGDLNLDHSITARAVITATRPMAGRPTKYLYSFEIPSSTEWSFRQFEPSFKPNLFVDITDTITDKLKALSIYEGESRKYPHPRSPESIEALAKYRGSMVGLNFAEAFELIRSIW